MAQTLHWRGEQQHLFEAPWCCVLQDSVHSRRCRRRLGFIASIRTAEAVWHYLTDRGKMNEITLRKSKAKLATRESWSTKICDYSIQTTVSQEQGLACQETLSQAEKKLWPLCPIALKIMYSISWISLNFRGRSYHTWEYCFEPFIRWHRKLPDFRDVQSKGVGSHSRM